MDIRTVRLRSRRSQRYVAGKAGIDEAALSQIERGLRVPRVDTLRRIVRALDMEEAEYLLASLLPRNGNGKP